MTCEHRVDAVELEQEQEQPENTEDRVVRRDGVLRSMLRGLFWPVGIVIRAYHGVWWVLGFRQPKQTAVVTPAVTSPARQSLAGRKRLHRVTRLLLTILPRWVQGALGYPVSSSIGRSLSPEVRVSPTKPCGKGSKRKQDELDEEEEDDDEEEHQTWVEALTQELDDEDPMEDPDYEPSTVETESEEYRSHNNTESDIEVQEKGVVIIEDVNTTDVVLSS
ncbi:oogenesis-related isoform X1 [Thunnus albacares]|uniref:oogenesis-related isoform X1 n=2 Tax=Thunnus albacares TaxID=8236 RepID=UPI001CF70394|nr:oogenesis-related isoform X1 [Thunnus albacares]